MGVFIGNGYGQATLVFSSPGLLAPLVVTHGLKDVPGTGLAAAASAAWAAALVAGGRILAPGSYANSYTFERVDVTIGTPTGPVLGTTSVAVTGTAAFNPAPANCAILVRKTTARGGRRGRGRNFWPPMFVDEGNVGPSGTIAAAQVTALGILLASTIIALNATNYPAFLLHDVSEIAPDAVTSWPLQTRLATQRTRLRK